MMTEAHAWRKLAEWCVENYAFLCPNTIGWAGGTLAAPFPAPWYLMHDRLTEYVKTGAVRPDHFWNETALASPEPNEHARVIFCLLMALECEEGGKTRHGDGRNNR
jgi:hypothetical protein